MRRLLCQYLILFCGLVAAWQAVAQGMLTLGAGSAGSAPATGIMIDPNANAVVNGDWSSGGTFSLPAMSSNNSNVIIYVVLTENGEGTIGNLSVTDTAGNSYGAARVSSAGSASITAWFAKSASALSGNVITLHDSAVLFTFATATAFAVANANFASPFDPNAAVPSNNGAGGSITYATTNSNTLAVYAARGAASYTPDAGWTSISNRNFMLVEYQKFPTPQGSITVSGSGGASNGAIADALTQ